MNKETNFFDLDSVPTVDILDSTETPITGLTGLTVNKVRKGVYKVTFGLDGLVCDGKDFLMYGKVLVLKETLQTLHKSLYLNHTSSLTSVKI